MSEVNPSPENKRPSTNLAASWVATLAIAGALVGGALWWRSQVALSLPEPSKSQKEPLPRTRKLVEQKVGSLEAYNQVIPTKKYLREFSNWTGDRPVKPEAFDVMSRLMVAEIVPELWREAQKIAGDAKLVTHQAMAKAVHSRWPQQLLPNGHVVLFPGHPILRKVASEYRQDYFRDTGWHWRWIGQALDRMPVEKREKLRELNIYGAEELSEFLSVLGVAVIELANREDRIRMGELDVWTVAKRLRETPLDADSVRQILTQLKSKGPDRERKEQRVHKPKYSKSAMEHVLNTLPKPMFVNITQEVGIDFRHESDPELRQRRSVLEVPTGIAGGSVSAGDYDGDGHNDLYLAGTNGGRLYLNVAGKNFKDKHCGWR